MPGDEAPIVLAATTGRCGTTYLASILRSSFAQEGDWISHEYLRQDITNVARYHRFYDMQALQSMRNQKVNEFIDFCGEHTNASIVDTGWTMRSLIVLFAHLFPNRLRVLHIHRHPVEVAASFCIMGSYTENRSKQWALDPYDEHAAFPEFADSWPRMSAFEKCMYLWLEVNNAALEFSRFNPQVPFLDVPSASLFSDRSVAKTIAEFCGLRSRLHIEPGIQRATKNKRMRVNVEMRPIQAEWRDYRSHGQVIELANTLGYDMSLETVSRLISRYQLPTGAGPWFRNKTGYWKFRRKVGNLLRRIGLRK